MKKLMIFFLFCTGPVFNLSAQEIKVEIERDTFSLEEQFVVKYTIDKGCSVQNLNFEHFIVVAGPSTSRSLSIVNGKRTAETSMTFLVTAIEEGVFPLPSEMCGIKMKMAPSVVIIKDYETKEDTDLRIRKKRKIKKI